MPLEICEATKKDIKKADALMKKLQKAKFV
jgi:hypothetical protein